MTEIGEMIAPPSIHTEPNEDCPFCPPPEQKDYKTYPGADNSPKKLAKIMKNPKSLTDEQPNARPQTAAEDAEGHTQEQSPLDPRKKDLTTFYTHQAHHLISGNQALKNSVIEKWILKSKGTIEKDTGYSVNSTGNGFWAPSVPKKYAGRWSPAKGVLTDEQRQQLAEEVMADANAQIHIGHHSITDPDDPDGDLHVTYDKYIKTHLAAISRRIHYWAKKCVYCDEGAKKPQPSYRVHDILDRFSGHLETKIKGPRTTWDIFISKYALEYHKPVCTHEERDRM